MRFARLIPQPVWAFAKKLKRWYVLRPYRGTTYYCPVCQKTSRKFAPYGRIPRKNAQCVYCRSLERHRLIWLYFERATDLFDGRPKKVLHVAPERSFAPRLQEALGDGYLTADLMDPNAMVRMDITDIQYPDETFDVIYCSHVLEHVPDDRRAMREFHRTLKRDGWALLVVPITAEKTFEDPSIVSPAERLAVFGQEDHVRRYGPDYADRLEEAGFAVEVVRPHDYLGQDEIDRLGLTDYAIKMQFHRCTRRE